MEQYPLNTHKEIKMNVLVASDTFIVRHFLADALGRDCGICLASDFMVPFHVIFDVVIISLDFKLFNAIDVANYYRKFAPKAKIIGLSNSNTEKMTCGNAFDNIFSEPEGYLAAQDIVKGFLNERVAYTSRSSTETEFRNSPSAL